MEFESEVYNAFIMNTQEIECRFLEINKEELIKKLLVLGAQDHGETMLDETIFYDPELTWRDEQRLLRLRKVGDKTILAYKEHKNWTVDGTYEIEFEVPDFEKAKLLFEKIGLTPFRHQQKKRHTFELGEVTFDIDTWPRIPAFVELEGKSEEELKKAAELVGLDWKNVNVHDARWVIENVYNIPVGTLRWFTFDRYE